MACKSQKMRHDPIKLIKKFWPDADISHITYDPNLYKGEYEIVRQSGGDGTMFFTIQMLQEALLPIVNCTTCFKPKIPKNPTLYHIRYKIGALKHVIVFGMIYLRCSKNHKYPGQRERVRLPVISEPFTL